MIRLLSIFFCAVAFVTTSVQATEVSMPTSIKKEIDITTLSKEIQKIEKEISVKSPSKNESVLLVRQLNEFYTDAQNKRTLEQGKLDELQKKITALGTLEEGDKESKEIAKQRAQFLKETETVKTQISKIDLALTQIDALSQKVANLRTQGP